MRREFDRSYCFTFFESYKDAADRIGDEYGVSAELHFLESVIYYALYGIEPKLDNIFDSNYSLFEDYVNEWRRIKVNIDASIARRKSTWELYNS